MKFFLKEWMIEIKGLVKSSVDVLLESTNFVHKQNGIQLILALVDQMMWQGARLVNVARGGLLDYEAVKEALASGQLGGLAMDVAWSEPFDPSDPILQYPNVLITPHVAGVTELSYSNMGKVSLAPLFMIGVYKLFLWTGVC
jgi:phosphoglycerate dehydrogenase-like enzyme